MATKKIKDTAQSKRIKELKKYRRRILTKLVKDAFLQYRKGNLPEMNNMICEEFTKLGGVYVKFMQGVLLKSSLMRDWNSSDKLKIFENLESEPIDIRQSCAKNSQQKNYKKLPASAPLLLQPGASDRSILQTLPMVHR